MVSGRDGADWWWWNAADRGPECTSATSSLFTRHATRRPATEAHVLIAVSAVLRQKVVNLPLFHIL